MDVMITINNVDKQTMQEALTFVAQMREGEPAKKELPTPDRQQTQFEEKAAVQEEPQVGGPDKAQEAITKEQLREVLGGLSKAGKTAAVKDILKDHGAAKLSDLSEDKYASCYQAAQEAK